MLRALSIRHFAIIDELELEFDTGFTAITGETGAGKSILIDALGLLLGHRADSSMIAEGQRNSELSATFDLHDVEPAARSWLEEQAMDDEDSLLLRRVLSASGSSRAWINGRSATIGQLAEIGRHLVEIHGQHEHQQLERTETQRRLLDQQVDGKTRKAVINAYERWSKANEALETFERDMGDAAQLELLGFQVRELNELQLMPGEFESMESEQERLARMDDIRRVIGLTAHRLDGDGGAGIRALLQDTLKDLGEVRELDPELNGIAAMLDEAMINIDEAIASVDRLDRDDETGGERLNEINARLERALDLARKHRVEGPKLPALTETLNERLNQLEHQGEAREALIKAQDESLHEWRKAADALHKERSRAAKQLSGDVSGHLKELGMERARLEFLLDHDPQARPSAHGADQIRILFAGNPGQTPRSLARVASGGELSRVSLALMIAARLENGPLTRIFDEVDAGIGGQTATVVGQFLDEVAKGGQAFCVTHLAQVAACADHQFRVVKSSGATDTSIDVRALGAQEREDEIARMLGGNLSEKSREHAAELLRGVARTA
ncbi:MAG: DNA repair protein RecN [Pseudomonadota bacterium]